MLLIFKSAIVKAFGIAFAGPIPIIFGSTPVAEYDTILANGLWFIFFINFSETTTTNAEPSDI